MTGEFKVINSMGTTSWGDGVPTPPNGCYWFTFDAVEKAQVPVFFYVDLNQYNPTYVVVFNISEQLRANLSSIVVGLGNPSSPVVTKTFAPLEIPDQGANAFPSNNIVLDISEFASSINSQDLFLGVCDSGSSTSAVGTINSLSVECYSTYSWQPPTPQQTLNSYSTLPLSTVHGSWVYAYVHTTGQITGASSAPTALNKVELLFNTRQMTDLEVMKLRKSWGVFQPGQHYSRVVRGRKTGFLPPTEAEWQKIRMNARTISSSRTNTARGIGSQPQPQSVDLTTDPAFPPVGDQGQECSCFAFSTTYYIKSYQAAKAHGWTINGPAWQSQGAPSCPLNEIMSPAFTYNLDNGGVDNGSSTGDLDVLTSIGCASWATMPYTGISTDCTSWPSETSWREAPPNRGNWPDTQWGTSYFLSCDSDMQIQFIETLLENDVPVSVTVDSNQYANLSPQYVWDTTNYSPVCLNHANTIVGYQLLTTQP
jgi:hypothetical protein